MTAALTALLWVVVAAVVVVIALAVAVFTWVIRTSSRMDRAIAAKKASIAETRNLVRRLRRPTSRNRSML